jgi:hypothetical protein
MDWFKQNAVTLFAIAGALYTAAWLIVGLTATKKDDRILAKVGTILGMIAKGFGLNPKKFFRKR